MFTPMKRQSIDEIKTALDDFRKTLIVELEDKNQLVRIRINGHFKIIQLDIHEDVKKEEIEIIVPELITKAIENIGNQIRKRLEDLQTVPS
jgi:DNA-binding protein YbaB